MFSRNYDLEDIERIIDKYIDDSRPADQLYDEMTAALQTLSQVSIVYRVFHKKHPLIFSSFLTQMLTNFNNSFTAAFSDELQKKLE